MRRRGLPSVMPDEWVKPPLWAYPLQVVTALAFSLAILPGSLLALIMVPLGMLFGWPRVTWLWSNKDLDNGLPYGDHWWYRREHWSWKLGDRFAQFWWMAVRNSFSNGKRYAIRNADPADVIKHPNYHYGFYKGPREWAFKGFDKPWPKTLFRYEYDARRPWLARYVFTWFVSDSRYFQFYIGFKFDRSDGFGSSLRCWVYRNEV